MQLFKFFQPYRKYIKTAKIGGFCEELLSENEFEAVLVNFCCYEYGFNASEGVQKISTRTLLKLYQVTKTDNFKATPMKTHIEQFITYLLGIHFACVGIGNTLVTFKMKQ